MKVSSYKRVVTISKFGNLAGHYCQTNTTISYDIVQFEHKLSWVCFGFSKRSHANGERTVTVGIRVMP